MSGSQFMLVGGRVVMSPWLLDVYNVVVVQVENARVHGRTGFGINYLLFPDDTAL